MYQLKYTPTVEEFANVSAAAILFGGFLIKTTFSSLLVLVPKTVSHGLFLVFAGLMSVPQHPTIHRIAKTLGIKSHDTLERCVMHKSWTVGCIMTGLINYLVTMLSGIPSFGYLILDDVLCAKPHAKKFPYVYKDYDYVNGKYTLAMRVVFLLWSNGCIKIPVGFALWHKAGSAYLKENNLPYKTKNQLARELIQRAIESKIPFDYITFDSWYASKENFRFLISLQVKFVTSLKSNSKIRFRFAIRPQPQPTGKGKPGHPKLYDTLTCKELARRFPTNSCHKYPRLFGLRARRFVINLKGISGSLTLVMVRNYMGSHLDLRTSVAKKQRRHPHKYILTNLMNLTTVEVVQHYQSRWDIEVFFRDLKQHLALGRCMGRTVEHAQRHLALICLAYTGIEIFRTHSLKEKEQLTLTTLTIGEAKLALGTQLFQVKQNGETLLISHLKPLNSKQLELFLEIADIADTADIKGSDNPWCSGGLIKEAFLTSA